MIPDRIKHPFDTHGPTKEQRLLIEEGNKMERKRRVEAEALFIAQNNMDPSDKEVSTTELDVNEFDIEKRVEAHEDLTKRLDKHLRETQGMLKGNDYKTATYVRKINLLTRKDFGLDTEGYKEYLENLKEIEKAKKKEEEEVPDEDTEGFLYPSKVRYYQSFQEYSNKFILFYSYTKKFPERSLQDYCDHGKIIQLLFCSE